MPDFNVITCCPCLDSFTSINTFLSKDLLFSLMSFPFKYNVAVLFAGIVTLYSIVLPFRVHEEVMTP